MLLQHFQEETSMNAKLFEAALMGHFVFLRSATKDTHRVITTIISSKLKQGVPE